MKNILKILIGIQVLLLTSCSTIQPISATNQTSKEAISASPTNTAASNSKNTATQPAAISSPTSQKTSIQATPFTLTPTLPSPTLSPTARPTLSQDAWMELPIIPVISESVLQIYQRGIELGNNLHSYSKLGDCGSTPAWFLGDFDRGPDFYRLGSYQDLEKVIHAFKGSHNQTSLAARAGFNASSLMTPLWADRTYCNANETPLACEYRVHKPVIALIMLGTNDIFHPDDFEPQMRKIIEYSIENGVIPILSTKADNEEGDHSINVTIARLAWEYDIPLWNFWLAVQPLPDHGLQEDRVHLTWGRNFFDDPEAMSKAWPIRNLTALQILDAVWRKVTHQSN